MKNLEFAIPASPNAEFCAQIAFFRLSLDRLGGAYKSARVIAVFGASEITRLPQDWLGQYENLDIIWAHPAEFDASNVYAQGELRFECFSREADIACFCDADTVLVRPIPEMIERVSTEPALYGSIAHASPFADANGWQDVFQTVLGRPPPLDYAYTLSEPEAENGGGSSCPFYVNQGVLFGTPELFRQLGRGYRDLRRRFLSHYDDLFFSGQISITLAIYDQAIPHVAIPMRYNFPNDPEADSRYRSELDYIGFLHYLRIAAFDRQKIFTSKEAFDAFLDLHLTGSNRVFQDHVRRVTDGVYPFARQAAIAGAA